MWVLGYGSLVDRKDHLVIGKETVYGHLRGFKRSYNYVFDNAASEHDDKYYVNDQGERVECLIASLNALEDSKSLINALAIKINSEELADFDHREIGYERLLIANEDFLPLERGVLNGELYIYCAQEDHLLPQGDTALLSKTYLQRVEGVFKSYGTQEYKLYQKSTNIPQGVERAELELVRAPGNLNFI